MRRRVLGGLAGDGHVAAGLTQASLRTWEHLDPCGDLACVAGDAAVDCRSVPACTWRAPMAPGRCWCGRADLKKSRSVPRSDVDGPSRCCRWRNRRRPRFGPGHAANWYWASVDLRPGWRLNSGVGASARRLASCIGCGGGGLRAVFGKHRAGHGNDGGVQVPIWPAGTVRFGCGRSPRSSRVLAARQLSAHRWGRVRRGW